MAKYKPQHARLLFIDQEIGGGYPSCGHLAEKYEVCRKTIYRDLDHIRHQLDAPLEYSGKHRGVAYEKEIFAHHKCLS